MRSSWFIAPAVLAASTSGYATTYLTVAQAQAAIFPGRQLAWSPVELTPAQRAAIGQASGVRVRSSRVRAWRVAGGGWFLLDEVLGKHEFITFALGLTDGGVVTAVEILDYRESYGFEIRDRRWRAQFAGKTARDPLRLDVDIRNISGATLSCRHITDGVKRLLATYEFVLK